MAGLFCLRVWRYANLWPRWSVDISIIPQTWAHNYMAGMFYVGYILSWIYVTLSKYNLGYILLWACLILCVSYFRCNIFEFITTADTSCLDEMLPWLYATLVVFYLGYIFRWWVYTLEVYHDGYILPLGRLPRGRRRGGRTREELPASQATPYAGWEGWSIPRFQQPVEW